MPVTRPPSRLAPTRPAAVALSLAVSLTLSSIVSAGVFTDSAPDGFNGLPPGSSAPGGEGSTIYHFEDTADLLNSVTLNAGNGGAGASPAGNGGNGGQVDASAKVSNPTYGISLTADATAIAGNGGTGSGSGTPGRGGDSYATVAAFTPGSQQDVTATALSFAGNGGDLSAGTGASAGDGGNATAGGFASLGDATLAVTLNAYGGNGGNVLDGSGNGGNGGNAATNTSLAAFPVERGPSFYAPETSVNIALAGGSGGQGSGFGFRGGNGAAPVPSPVFVGGNADNAVSLSVTGGNGGAGVNGAIPGEGAPVFLIDAVAGGAPSIPVSTLTLTQTAVAGAGGSADTGIAAPGATASSFFNRANEGGGSLQSFVTAIGGSGGDGIGSFFASGARGGDADAQVSTTNFGQAYANVYALGGNGGTAKSLFGNGGDGAFASVGASLTSLSSDSSVVLEARGGNGGIGNGPGQRGGNGGKGFITSVHVGSNAPDASLSIDARTTGGDGGVGDNGADAGNGSNAIVYNTAPTSFSNSPLALSIAQQARGGNGGSTVGGGVPGYGGVAFSTLDTFLPTGNLNTTISATGGNGGAVDSGFNAAAPGSPANVAAHLSAPGAVNATLVATGGSGGDVYNSPARAGSGGYLIVDPSSAFSSSSTVTLAVLAVGGNGGNHYNTTPGPAGDGASVYLDNLVTGGAPLAVDLTQSANGGAGGYSEFGGTPGLAGDASSKLVQFNDYAASLRTAALATGGTGGSLGHFGAAANGGSADSQSTANNTAGVAEAYAGSTGGAGGLGSLGAGGGNGGIAHANALSTTTGDAHASFATVNAVGGRGGNAANIPYGAMVYAGHGGSAEATADARATGDSPATASATAVGGAGGNASPADPSAPPSTVIGFGGLGGDAVANAYGTSTASTAPLVVLASALGGTGGQSFSGGGPAGGGASATAVGTSTGPITVSATANGGYVSSPFASSGPAFASAFGSGASGSVSAAAASNGPALRLSAIAASPAVGSNLVSARIFTGNAPDIVSPPPVNLQAHSFLGAGRDPADAAAVLAGRPNASSLLQDTATNYSNVRALASLGVAYAPGATGAQTYFANVSLGLDAISLDPSAPVYLALLTPYVGTSEFSNITLTIDRQENGSPPAPTLFSRSFTTLAAASDYLRDHVLNLGPTGPGSVNFDVILSATSATPGSRLAATLAFATRSSSLNRWVGPDGGAASDAANWSAGVVPAPGSAFNFVRPADATASTAVSLPADLTFSILTLDAPTAGFFFTGAHTLHTTSTPASIQSTANVAHIFNAPVSFHADTDLVGGMPLFGDAVTLDAGVNVTARAGASVTFFGPTTVSPAGASLTINDGSAAAFFQTAFYSPASPRLTLHNNGQFTLHTTSHLIAVDGTGSTRLDVGAILTADRVTQRDLTLDAAASLILRTNLIPTTSRLTSLSLAPASTLDLTNNILIAASGSSPVATIRQYLHDARLLSSSADATHRLAYLDSGTDITLALALAGDANVNGWIDPDDYALLDRSFAKSLTNAHWTDGDFDYDGSVTSADYLLLDTTYGQAHGYTFSPDFLSQRESQFGPAYVSQLLTAVPEPAFAGMMFAILPALARHRRRRAGRGEGCPPFTTSSRRAATS